jgi:murein L,D-transpeptidase YafK
MRTGLAIVSLALIAVAAGGVESRPAEPPSSERSREAVARLRPGLEAALAEKGLRFGAPVYIRIFKEDKKLELWVEDGERYRLFREFEICAYSGGVGPKIESGDWQSPEGFYRVTPDRLNPSSRFHLSIDLGFPNEYDRSHGRTGDLLMIHGACASSGCYAMTDSGIEAIYALVDAALRGGQPAVAVHIFPFRMTEENMEFWGQHPWAEFWKNLKSGHDRFEATGRPPAVRVRDGRYVFEDSVSGGPTEIARPSEEEEDG